MNNNIPPHRFEEMKSPVSALAGSGTGALAVGDRGVRHTGRHDLGSGGASI